MADTILFDIVGEIILNLGSSALKEIGSLWGVKNDLCKLKSRMSTIKAVLLDAEEKQTHNHQVSVWLEKLQDVVFDADDLVDEFHTEALQRRVMPGNKMRKQVCIFFSSSNQLVFWLKMGHKIKEIRGALDEIKEDRTFYTLDFKENRTFHSLEASYEKKELVSPNERETHSSVCEKQVIGRDDDRRAIIERLVDHETDENVSFIAIVGIGGLGKTTLAQLVYNDDKVQKHFDLRMWVCVSHVFDLKSIVRNIVESTITASLEQLTSNLKKKIDGKKYFLVLDDVWNENSTKWESLSSLLMGGARGSRVLVTTRCERVAEVTRSFLYPLKDLDQDNSWFLFEKQAFGQRQDFEKSDFVALGKEIVEKCKGVPLAIKSIGSILYFKKSKAEWLSFKDKEFAEAIQQEENNIIPTLKLSYNHLPSYLKHCFSYCRLFPKDYEYDVQELIKLWMAQGLIKPNRNQCPEDIGYGYFLDLLWRSFFQEAREDDWGNIRCKMHDLMHDLAISVAGTRSVLIDEDSTDFSENLVHVSFDIPLGSSAILKSLSLLLKHNYKLRTLFCVPEFHQHVYTLDLESNVALTNLKEICSEFKSLRALGLKNFSRMEKLPKNLGELKHLRYLDLSWFDEIQELPNSITKLQNLQTLNLTKCKKLSSLPRDMHKMVSLRHLLLDGCWRLSHMPSRLGELTCLQTLARFVVGGKQSRRKNTSIGEVGELRTLNSLRGVLRIENLRPDIEESGNPNLQQKQHLQLLDLEFEEVDDDIFVEKYEKSLELLQPHANLKSLRVSNYMGVGFASWVKSLTSLVELELYGCRKCRHLPPLHVLPRLQKLYLGRMDSMEYIDVDQNATATCNSSSCDMPFFPFLKDLGIWECPKLTSMPLFPFLEKLTLETTSSKPLLQTMTMTMTMAQKEASSSCIASSSSSSSSLQSLSKLVHMEIRSIDDVQSLPQQAAVMCNLSSLQSLEIKDCPSLTSLGNLSSLQSLRIEDCPNLTSLANLSSLQSLEIEHCHNLTSLANISSLQSLNIIGCSNLISLLEAMGNLSSLQSLIIQHYPNLTSLPEAMGNLSSLQSLSIYECPNLTSVPEAMGNLSSLQSLRITNCPNLTSVPEAMGNLSSLQSLSISNCPNLTSLPEAMGNLSSLQFLHIQDCPNLTSLPEGQMFRNLETLHIFNCPILQQRYKNASGEDWPKIAHISNLEFY